MKLSHIRKYDIQQLHATIGHENSHFTANRTITTIQAGTGASLPIIGKLLARKHVNTMAMYARLSLDPTRECMTEATQAMLDAVSVE